MANSGKVFEEDFRQSSEAFIEVDVNRLNDPVGGQAGVRNICDFIVYMQPYIYYLELKSRQGNTLSFKDITKVQWTGLQKKAAKPGAIPGVLVNYSDYNEAYFVHIDQLVKLRDVEGKKSLHIDFARQHGIKLLGERKRTRFAYDTKRCLRELGVLHG
jgi:penicillin-binding protein-related factor A (putative recombinase)